MLDERNFDPKLNEIWYTRKLWINYRTRYQLNRTSFHRSIYLLDWIQTIGTMTATKINKYIERFLLWGINFKLFKWDANERFYTDWHQKKRNKRKAIRNRVIKNKKQKRSQEVRYVCLSIWVWYYVNIIGM